MRDIDLKKLDLLLLVLFPVLALTASLVLNTNYLITTLLFFGLPAIYLSIRNPKPLFRSLIFSVILTTPVFLVGDYIATISGAWAITGTSFSFRILGILPVEDIIWGILGSHMAIMFYEHLLNKSHTKSHIFDKRMRYLIIPIVIIIGVFLITYIINPLALQIPYAYLVLAGIFEGLALISFFRTFPRLTSKLIKVGAYFFYVCFLLEITALQLGHWSFTTNNFIGWIEVASYKFPLEELIFFIMLLAMAVIAYYEYFDDDRK